MKQYTENDFKLKTENGLTSLKAVQNIETSLGTFIVSIDLEDNQVTNDVLIQELNCLIKHFEDSYDKIIDIVYKSYLDYDPEFIKELLGHSSILEKHEIHKVIEEQYIYIMSECGDIYKRVYFSILWDCEHGLYLEPANESWNLVDV